MDRDHFLGAVLLASSLAGACIYFWAVFFVAPLLVLQVTAFGAVAAGLTVLAWIGYTLASTPLSKSVEEIERELEEQLGQVEGKEHIHAKP